MALAAAQVVDALVARLVPMAATGGRVFTSRAWPLDDAALPAWRVTAGDEEVEAATVEGLNQHRLTVVAQVYARATTDLDDVLHALAEAGLTLLCAPPAPFEAQLVGIARGLTTEGEAAVGVLTVRLECFFFVDPATPGVIL